jgi:hypothetical protein
MKAITKVTVLELSNILFELKTNKTIIASVLQTTEPKMLVKSRINKEIKNTFNKVVKISKVSIFLNSDYETSILNQLKKEDKEESEYKKGQNTMILEFGENNKIIGKYNNEFVLQYRPNDNVKPKTKFLADGKITDKNKLVDFLPTENHATNQGTDREIFWRKLYLKNIKKLALNGIIYKIV